MINKHKAHVAHAAGAGGAAAAAPVIAIMVVSNNRRGNDRIASWELIIDRYTPTAAHYDWPRVGPARILVSHPTDLAASNMLPLLHYCCCISGCPQQLPANDRAAFNCQISVTYCQYVACCQQQQQQLLMAHSRCPVQRQQQQQQQHATRVATVP